MLEENRRMPTDHITQA